MASFFGKILKEKKLRYKMLFYKKFKSESVFSRLLNDEDLINTWRGAYGNNLLHLAVIEQRKDIVKFILQMKKSKLREETNFYSLSPYLLSKLLNNDSVLQFEEKKDRSFCVYNKKGIKEKLQQKDLEEYIGFSFIEGVEFKNFNILKWMLKNCKKEEKKNIITPKQKWMGFFYEKEILSGFYPDVSIRWVNSDVEFGLFTNINLKPNTYVGEYGGVIRKANRISDKKNPYCFEYLIGNLKKTPFILDAREKGNLTRFINHNENPNLSPFPVFCNGVMRIILLTNKTIKKESELTYNYGPSYWKKREDPK
jgi:hypothetical protein